MFGGEGPIEQFLEYGHIAIVYGHIAIVYKVASCLVSPALSMTATSARVVNWSVCWRLCAAPPYVADYQWLPGLHLSRARDNPSHSNEAHTHTQR